MDGSGTRGISLKRYRQFFRHTMNEVEFFDRIRFQSCARPLGTRKIDSIRNKKKRKEEKRKEKEREKREVKRVTDWVRRCRVIWNENPAVVSIFRLFGIQM